MIVGETRAGVENLGEVTADMPVAEFDILSDSNSVADKKTQLDTIFRGTNHFTKKLLVCFEKIFWEMVPSLIMKNGLQHSTTDYVQTGYVQGDVMKASGESLNSESRFGAAILGQQCLQEIMQNECEQDVPTGLRKWAR